jgi:hypothetical protein
LHHIILNCEKTALDDRALLSIQYSGVDQPIDQTGR